MTEENGGRAHVVEHCAMEYVVGTKAKPEAADRLLEELRALDLPEGTLYIGYPVLSVEQSAESVDALLTSTQYGVVIFDLLSEPPPVENAEEFWRLREEHQTRLFLAMKSKLTKEPGLTSRRDLAVTISVLTYTAFPLHLTQELDLIPVQYGRLREALSNLKGFDPKYMAALNATIQRVTTMKPIKKRPKVLTPTSKGAIMKELEKGIANLDRWQKRGAIECPEGPQRLRGLAGSGKTIILALKAAYLHAQHPDWHIVVTFHTRSLYQQFIDLIRRFYFEQTNDEPDWNKLHVLHSWGTPREPGLYARIAALYGVLARDFNSAKIQFGYDRAFGGICDELEGTIKKHGEKPTYDAILIDEAQDLPQSFFRLAYAVAKPPKRIVWAYDEMQNLGAYSMESPATLFGTDSSDKSLVDLENPEGEAHQDVVLKMCYRNTPWALALAHALGFGIHRKEGLVQLFDDPDIWAAIGYELASGTLAPGSHAVLRRGRDASPAFFQRLQPDDAILCRVFRDATAQAQWVAQSIEDNVRKDELDADDILVIYPNPLTVPERSEALRAELAKRGMSSHIAGVTTSRDEFFLDGSVTISGIYRAKGNEAPVVYVLDSEFCNGFPELAKKRSMLFTAITRSRAWVRICGVGAAMEGLKEEVENVVRNDYALSFTIPTDADLKRIRRLHKDMTPDEKKRLAASRETAEKFADALESGAIEFEQLPPETRQKILRSMNTGDLPRGKGKAS